MRKQHLAILFSHRQQFGASYQDILRKNGFTLQHEQSMTAWLAGVKKHPEICICDNMDGEFPFESLLDYVHRKSPHTAVFNAHDGHPYFPEDSFYFYNLYDGQLSLDTFLSSLNAFFRRVKSRTDLAAMLIHDIRSPLNSMLAYSELLLNQSFGELNDGQKKFLEKSMVLGDQVLDMLEDLNEVYKSEQYIFSIEKEPFEMETVIEQALLNLWVQADRKQIVIQKSIEYNLPHINGDAFQIQRVLMNLIGNAVKYCPAASTITVSANRKSRHLVEVVVSDNGGGIAEDHLKRVFRKSIRIEDKTRQEKGHGLGLYICKIIVKAHSGAIHAENNTGGGLSVVFTLPVIQ